MITGDYPGTALAVAREAGLESGEVMTGRAALHGLERHAEPSGSCANHGLPGLASGDGWPDGDDFIVRELQGGVLWQNHHCLSVKCAAGVKMHREPVAPDAETKLLQ